MSGPLPWPKPRIGAVLLAAGAGSRMGYRPKSLMLLDGQPLIQRMVGQLRDAGVSRLVVVLGHHSAEIGAALATSPVQTVHNPDPDQGLVSSQRLGLAALGPDFDGVVMALADQPLVNAQDIRSLIDVFVNRPAGTDMVFPQVGDQPGNPVVLSHAVREEILSANADWGCKAWRASQAHRTHVHVSDNPHFITDIDRPQDIAEVERLYGTRLHWPVPG